MGVLLWVAGVVILLAYANGANDNFKGVATLRGSRTLGYRAALSWATVTTFAGSLAAVWLSARLAAAFSGQGLVPDALTQEPSFRLAVGLGAALTVLLATASGLPISTTHALTGALIGAGVTATGSVDLGRLGQAFLLPLALSPFLSWAITMCLYPAFRSMRLRLGIERQMCLCVDGGAWQPVVTAPGGVALLQSTGLSVTVGQRQQCMERYHGRLLGIDAQQVLDRLHLLSAGAVSFARGLNDTPKIVALLVAAQGAGLALGHALWLAGVAMALGGWRHARRVAATMSERITGMNHGQGFTANLTTSLLVLVASRLGLPVSTTHVVCGSLFGLGTVTGQARWAMIRAIIAAWVGTLPLAACLAAAAYWMIGS
ncbi:MAG: inorganic phosphate transporter [Candidatus Omnitrophica bacterium]|nr:inorganic phosphate transporter [Candidatus Omnitrophota bacterium]